MNIDNMVNFTHDYRNIDEMSILLEQVSGNEKLANIHAVGNLPLPNLFLEVSMVCFFEDNLTISIKVESPSLLVQ